jgi:hypothetical protein
VLAGAKLIYSAATWVPKRITSTLYTNTGTVVLSKNQRGQQPPYSIHIYGWFADRKDDTYSETPRFVISQHDSKSVWHFDGVLGNVQAVSDTPRKCFAGELIEAYPNAKIILNHRPNIDAWQDSIASVAPSRGYWFFSRRNYFG